MAFSKHYLKIVFAALAGLSTSIPMTVWGQANLENPADGGKISGIGVISGWRCEPPADGLIQILIDNDVTMEAPYGSGRADTEGVCGDTDNGWGATFNFGLIGDGEHTISVSADGEQFGSATFTVGMPGEDSWLEGAPSAYHYLSEFPDADSATVVQWQQSLQNFVIVDSFSGVVPQGGTWRTSGDNYEICWHVADDGSKFTKVGSDCDALWALRIQGEGLDAHGQPCVVDTGEIGDIPILDGVFVWTFFNQNVGEEEVISSTYAVFTSGTEAFGSSIAFELGSGGCTLEFSNTLDQ